MIGRRGVSMSPFYSCCLLYIFAAGPTSLWLRSASAERVLKQVHVVSRHGSKSFFDDSVHLSPFGKEQMRSLGLFLRDKYGSTVVLRDGATHVTFRASGSGTAILSAQILAHVLFEGTPGTSDLPSVPVYSTADANDVYIRAYNKCPEGIDQEIETLMAGAAWGGLRNEHAALLSTLAGVPAFEGAADGSGSIPLENLFEVYDAVSVARDECRNVTDGADAGVDATATNATGATAAGAVCSEDQLGLVGALSEDEWKELYQLAQTIELDKYDSEMAGRLGGINLWKQILEYADDVKVANESDGFYVWSGHFETILTMFSAVREEVPRSGVNGSAAIPAYGSAIIVEGYIDNETGDKSVRVLYMDAHAPHSKTVEMGICDGEEYCSLDTLLDRFRDFDLGDWCDECGNEESDVCMNQIIVEAESIGSANDDRGSPNGTSATVECPPWEAASRASASGASVGAVIGTFFAGLAVIGLVGMGWF